MQDTKRFYTIKDIAKMAGVSHMTVSRVINGSGNVKKQTHDRIKKICDEIGYMPNAAAEMLRKSSSRMIGIVVPNISSSFSHGLAENLERLAYKNGFETWISSSFYDNENEDRIINRFMQNRVGGIIAVGANQHSIETLGAYKNRTPFVFVGENVPLEGTSWVRVDRLKEGRTAVDYLKGMGHKKIALVGSRTMSTSHRLRREAFREVMDEYGLEATVFGISNESDGYAIGKDFFSLDPDVTAVIAINSKFAIDFMRAGSEAGKNPPDDYSLISFFESKYAAIPQISLTTVSQSIEETSLEAFSSLLQLMEDPDAEPIQKYVDVQLHERKTCKHV